MIIDACLFLHEVELLELRFHTLKDVVDKFVVVETHNTFAGRPNPNLDPYRFYRDDEWAPFRGRIVHHIVRLPPPAPDGPFPYGGRWPVEYAMRNAIGDALRPFAQPEDYVMISDVDEIPDPTAVGHLGTFLHRLFVYQANALFSEDWAGTVGVRYADLIQYQPQYFRGNNAKWPKFRGGWHFSYQGGPERMREKVMAGGDAGFDTEAYLSRLAEHAAKLEDPMGRPPPAGLRPGRLIPVDHTFPAYLREHPERFPGWIAEVP